MNKFILALFQEKHKLKSTTLYQVLIGRRTTSVLSYAYFNDLLPFFGIFPELKEEIFAHQLATLEKAGEIVRVNDDSKQFQLTSEKQNPTLFADFPFLNSFRFGRKEQEAWHLVQFLTQVASYLGKSRSYLPLASSTYDLMKTRQFVHLHKPQLRETIYAELSHLFQALPRETSNFLSQTLTGFQQNGAAFFQLLPEQYQETPWSQIYLSNHLHAFFAVLLHYPDFLLYEFLWPTLRANQNQSALFSKQLFQSGLSLEAIGVKRGLKQGTLHDHLLEWAMLDVNFPFSAFLTKEKEKKFQQLPQKSWEFTYRQLQLSEEIPFFELRLYQIREKRGEK
ncbi:helix-turn-helix domain-containing protein [Enterococcus sp. LJL98]